MPEEPVDNVTHPQDGAPDTREVPAPDGAADGAADEETGASPGTAQACSDLGLNSLSANLDRFGIKPPGQS